MALNLNLQILPNFATTNTSLNLIHCIEEFDSGFNSVYILDENGEYTGFAVTKDSFKKIWKSIDDSLVSVPRINDTSDNQEILNQAIKIFSNSTNLLEIPLLKNNRISAIVTVDTFKQPQGFIWSNITDSRLSPDMREYNKIYLSSLENRDILNFYNCWGTRLPLIPLGNDNLMEAIQPKEDTLIVYAEDFFPDCNKISIDKLWNKLVIYALNQMLNFCYISENWASVKQSDSHNLALFIQKFDQGFHAVSIVDEEDKFVELVVRSTFREDFPKKNFRRWNNLYIDYSDDETAIKWNIANWCFGTSRRELPILRDRKIIAAGRLCKTSTLLQDREEHFPPIYWDMISDNIAEEFFGDQRKILISSEYGNLVGFRERFNKMLDITVYDDSVLEKYLAGEFDVLIYDVDVWGIGSIIKYSARQIYVNLLSEQIRLYLEKQNINFWLVENYEEILNLTYKINYSSGIGKRCGGELNRFNNTNVMFNEYVVNANLNYRDLFNSSNGVRKTTNQPKNFERSIYLFGPCLIIGSFVKDSQTISSQLQNIINENSLPCRVVNYGVFGGISSDTINYLYQMMDTPFNKGDIIVLVNSVSFNLSAWHIAFREHLLNCISIKDAFYQTNTKNIKPFADSSKYHLNAEGNKIVAEFLWEKLKDTLTEKVEQPRQIVPALFSITPPLNAA